MADPHRTADPQTEPAAAGRPTAPRLPLLPEKGHAAGHETLRELRRCFAGAAPGEPLPADALPALLLPFRDPTRVRNDYPLVLPAAGGPAGSPAGGAADVPTFEPLSERLARLAERATAQARVIRDNLLRWERRVRLQVGRSPVADGTGVLRAAAEQMLTELQLGTAAARDAAADVAAMLEAQPDVELLPLCAQTAQHLLHAVAARRVRSARRAFRAEVVAGAEQLRALLQVEAHKDPEARSAAAMQRSLGPRSDELIDAAALARTVGQHRGTTRRDPARRQRLQEALAALEAYLAADPGPAVVAIDAAADGDVCRAAARRFDELSAPLVAAVRAVRTAALEQRGAYEPARHDPRLAALRWDDCAPEELHTLPVVVAAADAAALAGTGLPSLLQLLTSGRPVQVLAALPPAVDPAHEAGGDGSPLAAFRLELGYLGIALREVYVQQSAAARPGHLVAGFEQALAGSRPGLHVVDPGLDGSGQEPRLGAFLHSGAAIEGRAHPLLHYDPEAGDSFARRLDFEQNPTPDADWPRSQLRAAAPDGGSVTLELAFTFADFALLEPRLRSALVAIPDELDGDELLALGDYLDAPPDTASHALPFVWFGSRDDDGAERLHRALVTRPLVAACRDRLRFLRTLQELSGVRSEHVRDAVQRARQEAEAEAARQQQALEEQHGQDLARVREEATASAMQGLARMLLELDGDAEFVLPRSTPAQPATGARLPQESDAVATPAAAAPTEAAAPAAAAAPAVADADGNEDEDEDEDQGFDEPWIESVRCSTCDDCVRLNPLMFVYNENKQAMIKDPRAGTYAQLVQAAEKCPSRCIHPGLPLNPDEPGLDELVERAAPFNR